MRIGWIGFHMEGIPALEGVLEQGFPLHAVITLKPELRGKRSGAADYRPVCSKYSIPVFEVANINDDEGLRLLKELAFDLVFVIGWTQLIRTEALNLPRLGMIGAHASLLPHNRGRAPINWALIKGERQTGNSLMWLAEGIDRGDIIDQVTIPVTLYDTCASVYEKVAQTNRDMILRVLPAIFAGQRPGRPQSENGDGYLPGRKPDDGLVNWSMSSNEVYNFLRALTAPYPGAFSWLEGRRWFLWQCSLLPHLGSIDATPGQIVGPIYSPVESACGQVVACGTGAIALLNVEAEDGRILKGRVLSDQPWKGKTWTNGG